MKAQAATATWPRLLSLHQVPAGTSLQEGANAGDPGRLGVPPGMRTSNVVTLTRWSRRLGPASTVSGGSFRGGANGADTSRLIRRLPGLGAHQRWATAQRASSVHAALRTGSVWVRPAAVHTTSRRPSLTRPVSLRAVATGPLPGSLVLLGASRAGSRASQPGRRRSSPVHGMGTGQTATSTGR